jgi:hypothetical protein
VVKRRNGLDRCRYKGYVGMNRWVGLGVIADNIVNIGRAMEKQAAPLGRSWTPAGSVRPAGHPGGVCVTGLH